jgi:choline-glycine betaine transporter
LTGTKDILRGRGMKILAGIGTIIVLLAFCWGIFTYLERYALCEDVKKVGQRLEQKIQADRFIDTKRMMFEISKEYKGKSISQWPEKDQKLYKELEIQLDLTEKSMKK